MTVVWLFGRGLSIECDLSWSVPPEWRDLEREEKVEKIKTALREEMFKPQVDRSVIAKFLGFLDENTVDGYRHLVITTNWDYLIQHEVLSFAPEVQPYWLVNSHVFHLNGSVEKLPDESNRSPFLLEEDSIEQRGFTPEANMAYTYMLWQRIFVVVGMSFECSTDRFLLNALGRVSDDFPIGESLWFLVNPDCYALELAEERILSKLPNAKVKKIALTFGEWLEKGLLELQELGVSVVNVGRVQ